MASNKLLPQTDQYFRIIFLISSLCGFFPYHLKKDNFRKVLSLCFYVTIVSISFTVYPIFSIIRYMNNRRIERRLLFKALYILLLTMMPLVTLLGVATSSSRALAINKILHSLREIDCLFCAKDHWITLSSNWKEKNIIGISCLLLYIVYYHYFAGIQSHLMGIYFFLLSVGVYLSASQFCATGLLIRKRFSSLHYSLKQIRLDGNVSLAIIEIKHLIYLHNQLCDVAMLLNESFTIQLSVHIASGFMVIVIVIFYLTIGYLEIKTFEARFFLPNKSTLASVQKLRIIIVILYFSTIWQICTCSANISKKV